MSFLDVRYRIHLEWMFENQPQLVRQLMRSNKLKEHLDRKDQAGMRLVLRLKENQGLSEEEGYEVATHQILAPPDGPAMSDNPPKALNWKEQEVVYKHLDRAGDQADQEESRQATKH